MVATTGALRGPRVAAAHRPQRPIQPRARNASCATRTCGGSQKKARRPQESRGHRDPRRHGPRGRSGSNSSPWGQMGSAAATAVSTTVRKLLHCEKSLLRSGNQQGRPVQSDSVEISAEDPPRSRCPAPRTDEELGLLSQSKKSPGLRAPEPDRRRSQPVSL